MKRSLALILIIGVGLSAASCGSKKAALAPEVASSDEALFKEGEKYVKKDPERARLFFRQVIDSFPKSFYAQRAKLAVADSYFNEGDEGNIILAASEYREFISLHPLSPSAPYAQYRLGLCFYDKSAKPGRDQQKTIQALAEFKKTITAYPLTEEAKLARAKIKECEERLAEHTFTIGLHYYRTEAFKASTSRLNDILTNYPEYSGMDTVYFYLGDSYFNWKKADQSVPYFRKLITDYPKSKYAAKAAARLIEIEKAPPAITKK
ncbi:MAG: outer membrane protein assembly factor BamD [Candidatus Aminicenantes bacterium]|nr:outer membrane protein assembly factor BamD [Candidatus Aminicenantes bacterium]